MNPPLPAPDGKDPSLFEEQILRFQDGTLTPEELTEFSAAMGGNPERQQAFIEMQFRSALIREILQRQAYEIADSGEQDTELPPASRNIPFRDRTARVMGSRRGLPGKGVALAAVALVILGGAAFFRNLDPPLARQDSGPAPVLSMPQVVVAGVSRASFFGRGSLEAGQTLPIGHDCMLRAGMVKLAFPSGATAIIEGPAMFRVTGYEALALDTGVCSVHAPEGAEGFRVVTPVTQVVDRGTRFSVRVSESTETEVQVIEGAADLIASNRPQFPVENLPSTSATLSQEVRLTERQAVRFSGFGKDQQQPASFDPADYRRQLPDRIVDYKASTTESGAVRELQQVTVQRNGKIRNYAADELIPIEVISFRGEEGADGNGHLLGRENPPRHRHGWLEDLRLDTGVINFGGGPLPLDRDPILQGPEVTPGLGIRFCSPVINHAGPDIVFFEIQCFTNPLEGDPFHVSPVHFRPGLKTKTITHYDLTMSSPESREVPPFWLYRYFDPVRSLEELSILPIEPNGGVMRLHFRALAVGIDLSDLGYAEGEQVNELFFQHATVGKASQVDPVLIAGLPSLDHPKEPAIPEVPARTEEVKK